MAPGDQLSALDSMPEEEPALPASAQPTAPVPPAVPAEEPAPAPKTEPAKKAQKPSGKSRVGTMFDLLTFSDV